jgi:transposase
VENEIDRLIACEQELLKMSVLLQSIIGIGPVIATHLIAYTGGFRRFQTWRQFSCYIGAAPFPFSSGSSIKGKTKVSHLANKSLKALFFLAASTAIQHDPELKRYYEHRISLGHNHMSVLNIIRNKLISRAFAVINRGTPYVKLHAYAA